MKKIISIILLIHSLAIFSQQQEGYTRSSLHLTLVDDFDFEGGEYVLESYKKFKFPENYNNHTIDLMKIKLTEFELTAEEKAENGKESSLLGDELKASASESTGGLVKIQDNSMVKLQLDKFIAEKNVANELVKKWWSIAEDGAFSKKLMFERTLQTLTAAQASVNAESSIEADLMNPLISNTFVVFTRLYYLSNEVFASTIRTTAYAQAAKLPGLAQKLAIKAADKVYEKTKEGYSVWTTAWLYKLKWDATVLDTFISTIDQATGKVDLDKFNTTNFELEYLSQEKATSLVTFSLKEEDKDRTEQDVFDLATVRNMSKVLVKLQKKNDVFKPIFPLKEGFKMAAGTKEGVSGDQTFEVLEKRKGEYKRIGKMKVDKKRVWNNSWTGEDIEEGFTFFKKGSKKFIPNIHFVRLIK